jgi:serine/threonine protein kinase/formylglycine-generating enzyme required for sulfatase activity
MTFESLPTTVRNELRAICDSFENSWRGGQQPRIEDYLGERTEPERTVLFQMLLKTEVDFRTKGGDVPERRDYLERFEAYTDVIRSVLADTRPGESSGAEFASTPGHGPSVTRPDSLDTTAPLLPGEFPCAADADSTTVPVRIGQYQVIRFLGEGNFVVYLARDDRDGRLVAIKVARPDMPESRRRLMSLADEADKIRALVHPQIVKFYEYVPPGEPGIGADGYIVLEYVEGRDGERTLEELLRAGPLPVPRLIGIVALIADALHYAHTHPDHLVHRDLKPSNILLDQQGEPRVCDFGLALNEDIQRLRRGEIAGTPLYMAPEQVRGEAHRLDGRTDIWALGVILYRGLTGRLPFPGPERDEIFDEILHRDPRPLRMYDAGIDPELERICLRCLARPMAERYLTASDLTDDLKRASSKLQPQLPPIDSIMYKGLRPFDVEDARFFLALLPGPRRGDGMPESVRFWKDRVESIEGAKSFSVGVLYGPSGGGKSSFVRAGLLPNLERGAIRTAYIEATPSGTEARLLAELRRAAPKLPADINLPDAVALLREGPERQTAGKLFLVLDQFEQWLQAHPDEPESELVRALRQCDGRRVGALLVVRDDFWMAVTRFLRAVDVPLVQGGNSAAVELFDARHTRKVFEAFGRALGQVADTSGSATSEATLFLDEAVSGLTDAEGRVIPMRLSLFTEVVRHRAWTPKTLRDLGGVDGIGVKFLDDCLARPEYKHYREAVKGVLKELLPAPASVIRGKPQGGGSLRKAAGYAEQPETFNDLMRVLTQEMRLVSVAESEGGTPGPARVAPADEARYQLAHDYLVRPIRHWMEREEGATRKGRARLRLKLVTASWLDRPGTRQLPSLVEWAGIIMHTAPADWSADERRLLRTATRHYLTKSAAALAILVALALGVMSIRDHLRARDIFQLAINSGPENVGKLLAEVRAHSGLLRRNLERVERDAGASSRERANATLLLHREQPTADRAARLRAQLVGAGVEEVELIRNTLATDPATAGGHILLNTLRDDSAADALRLRAACAFAGLVRVDDKLWEPPASALVRGLLAEDRRAHQRWLGLLGPARAVLDALRNVCADAASDPATRSNAAEVLARTLSAQHDSGGLARALALAQPEASLVLLRELERMSDNRIGLVQLQALAAGPPGLADDQVSHQAMAAIALGVLGRPESLRLALRHHVDPRLRSEAIHMLASLKLAPRLLLERLPPGELDAAERQGLLLAWAETLRDGIPPPFRVAILERARQSFEGDADPGVHSAAELLIRRWDPGSLPAIAVGTRKLESRAPRGWEAGPNGHTLVYLRGPLVFRMGSPANEPKHMPHETLHIRRIERSLLVATTETTEAQYRKFQDNRQPFDRSFVNLDRPVGDVSWYDAIAYCNWLSRKAGLEPFFPDKVSPRTILPNGGCDRGGFRLPTEAEWEYLCRAETQTCRPFGESERFLDKYVWTLFNTREKLAPVSQLLPNEFGVFDTLGSLWEWCLDGPSGSGELPAYPEGTKSHPTLDPFRPVADNDSDWRIVRGACFTRPPSFARSAYRDIYSAGSRNSAFGFRVVRTVAPEEEARERDRDRPHGD